MNLLADKHKNTVDFDLKYTIFHTCLQEKQNGKVVVLIVNTTTSEEKSSLPAYAF